MTSLPTPEGSGTPRTLLGGALRSGTPLGITPQEQQQVQTQPCSPSTADFGVFHVGMIPFNPGKKIPWVRAGSKQGAPASPPRARSKESCCAPWCFGVKTSLFGLWAQKAFTFQLSEIQGCRPSLKLTTASGTFQEGLKALPALSIPHTLHSHLQSSAGRVRPCPQPVISRHSPELRARGDSARAGGGTG